MAPTDTTAPKAKAPATKRAGTKAPKARAASAGASRSRAKSTPAAGGARSSTRGAAKAPARSTVDVVGDYAERAVLIPVGAALIARERVAASVNEAITSYSSPSKAQTQLRRFERRGSTARSRVEREVRKTRTRVERELRKRRRELDRQRERLSRSLTSQVEQTQTQIERTQTQVEDVVRARLESGADLANRVQERVLSLV